MASDGHGAPPPSGLTVVGCDDLDRAVDRYREVGFELSAIGPADEPTWAELTMPGIRLLVDATLGPDAGPRLRIDGIDPSVSCLPPAVEPGPVDRPLRIPPTAPSLAIGHETADGWIRGRAGMRYRDLIPDRWGGAYIASHIHVPDGGPVPDYVHHHDVAHQLIFCHRGWVEVVYEDQGPPFVLEPGDCVLQPPGIRHRVLAASDDLYVVEVTCPATHRTSLDHRLDLPNDRRRPDRVFGGQRFVRHRRAEASWEATDDPALSQQVTGLAAATDGLVSARVVRAAARPDRPWPLDHDLDLRLLFLLAGRASLVGPAGLGEALSEGSSAAIPPSQRYQLDAIEPGTELLLIDARAAAGPG